MNPDSGGAPCRIGIVGTGFIARGFYHLTRHTTDLRVTKVLTRRDLGGVSDWPDPALLTQSADDLYEHSDIVLECSGDVFHATEVVEGALKASRKVVTMNSEFHVTTGSAFVDQGFLTEANGDQPGVLATMRESLLSMGFEPLVYGNIKGFLNENPSREDMEYWSAKSGVRMYQITSFTDGTKVEVELVLVANAFGADILPRAEHGPASDDYVATAKEMGQRVIESGRPTSDYILSRSAPPRVFITATHQPEQQPYLRYLKQGEGPTYVLVHNTHLCHLEIPGTVRRVWSGGPVLLNNSAQPRYSLKSIAKRDLQPGERIEFGIGSFELRGEAIRIADAPDHVPIGLIKDGVIKRKVSAGEFLREGDIELPESRALSAWQEVKRRAV
jgi:predicted homoserine dehydrogenase-like protein